MYTCMGVTVQSNFTIENQEDATLTKWPRLTSLVINPVDISCAPWYDTLRRALCLCGILFLNIEPQSNLEKTSDKAKSKNIVQNNWLILFEISKVIKDKERLRNCHRLEKSKELWWVNTMWHPAFHPGAEKGH